MNDKFFEMIGISPAPWDSKEVERAGAIAYKSIGFFDSYAEYAGDDYIDCASHADVNLVLAAPEMLEALIESCSDSCKDCKTFHKCKKSVGCCQKIYGHIIEKATGKPIDEVLRLWEDSCDKN